MQVREVITSLTFRFIAKYLLVLSAGVFLLMLAIYSFFSYDYFRELSGSIVEEEETALAAGATQVEILGGYNSQPYDPATSVDLVMIARK